MDLKITGKTALVLGASTGLGQAIAKSLVDEGVRVAIGSRNLQKLEISAKKTGAEKILQVDMGKTQEGIQAIETLLKEWGRLDILVINTGGPKRGNFGDISLGDWQEAYQGLFGSTIECIQTALPSMKKNKFGRILIVTSFAAKEPMSGLIISNAYRSGLLGLAKSISNEVAADGITVNALLPGYTRTARVLELGTPEEKIAAGIPARRLGDPEEFASLATYLSSVPAAYITGQAIAVDGGYSRSI